MRLAIRTGMLLLLLLLPRSFPGGVESLPPLPPPPGPFEVVRGTIERNSSLAETLDDHLSPRSIYTLVEAARPAYDLARVSADHAYGLALGPDGDLQAFTYVIDELQTLRVSRQSDRLAAEVERREYQVETAGLRGVIRSSLFLAVTDLGEQDQLAMDLADIFAWDVDFNTEIQSGDSFRVAVEKLHLDGRFCRYGRILAAEFVRGDRVLQAIRFETDKGAGYYAPDGTPLRKAFLRSPLRFTRISSRFSRHRLHPILKTVRPHLGVDYAAPTGTPVHAAASGTVVTAGWLGGYGKTVRIRHANGFQTLYGHLSRIDVRRGQRVSQGTRIGAVGQTGLATGPHLDYRMQRNGVFVNPLTLVSPPAEPLDAAELAQLRALRDQRLALLPSPLPPPEAVVAAAATREPPAGT
jgi:murein DD-endopeptidase MepM/ murein hydrolase activator NlpD